MIKKYLNRLFIDGLSGMAYGLFSTLIIGTIICQLGVLIGQIPGAFWASIAGHLNTMGRVAKVITGAGIGVGVAVKLKSSPLTTVSAAVAGMVGAFPKLAFGFAATADGKITSDLINIFNLGAPGDPLGGAPGEPLGAFVAAYVAIEIGALISGKTKLEIILTPLCCIISGCTVGLLIGPYIAEAMTYIGKLVTISVTDYPIIGGMIVSVVMGMLLTLPISSAAIGISMGLGGLAAGAATIGCCCNMVGFAVISYRENKLGGLVAQGVGTSMIQMPNIVKKPIIWLPSIISSALLGPVSSAVLKMTSDKIGSGMGSAGFVGQIQCYTTMVSEGTGAVITIIEIIAMHFILPAAITLGIAEIMRRIGLIKKGDLKLADISHA